MADKVTEGRSLCRSVWHLDGLQLPTRLAVPAMPLLLAASMDVAMASLQKQRHPTHELDPDHPQISSHQLTGSMAMVPDQTGAAACADDPYVGA